MQTDRPFWHVQNCGKSYRDVKDWEEEFKSCSIILTEEEKKSKFAKYFYRDLTEPTPELLLAAERENELPEEETFMPDEFAVRMNAENIKNLKSGYRVLNNGIGFTSMRVLQPGLTDEVMDAFLKYYKPEGDLFYKNWYPNVHARHYSDMAIENVGRGMERVFFVDSMTAEKLGVFEDTPGQDPACIAIDGGVVISEPMHQFGKNRKYLVETCYYRDIPGGRETIINFWIGLTWKDGKFISMLPEGEKVDQLEVRALFEHCAWEFAQQQQMILLFWEDWQKGYFK